MFGTLDDIVLFILLNGGNITFISRSLQSLKTSEGSHVIITIGRTSPTH